MGTTEIANHFLPTTTYRESGTVGRDTPVIYERPGNVTVAWYQPLRLTGNYRMELQLSRSDIMRLFKCYFGSEIQQAVVEKYGLTFSPEVVKSILKTVKLTDLTLGELIAMNSSTPANEEPEKEDKAAASSSNVTPLPLRRI
jgi:hypothetical protein